MRRTSFPTTPSPLTKFLLDSLGHKAEKYHEHKQAEGKPGVGAKISGTLDELVGKVTSNPAKVQEGESKKTGGI